MLVWMTFSLNTIKGRNISEGEKGCGLYEIEMAFMRENTNIDVSEYISKVPEIYVAF